MFEGEKINIIISPNNNIYVTRGAKNNGKNNS